ncbi:MAG: hypothetical protein ACRDPV_08090 [Gaiellaceae bacterium]
MNRWSLRRRLVRWAPLTGIVFVALWIVTFALLLGGEAGESDAEIVDYYSDDANRGMDVVAFDLIVAASLVFLVFLAVARSRFARTESSVGFLPTMTLGSGIAAATLWLVSGVFWMAVAYTASETKEFRVDPNTERLVSEMAYLFFVTGMYATIPFVLGTSLLALRTRALPRWLGWLGLLVSVSLLGALGVVPFFLFLGWVLLVSIVFIVRQPVEAAATAELARVRT